ncbi:hypothetical protein Nepgr_007912 [Nepenthes gracilis]|uniref:Uncharacterized protein n=1 Tax=Nepenthes gracilis TaxID=150966 RepID=A0AAD3XIQ1_NEPGR|nr:hypothetical protein Nepgr_007912 [Nepenthes gracilis]
MVAGRVVLQKFAMVSALCLVWQWMFWEVFLSVLVLRYPDVGVAMSLCNSDLTTTAPEISLVSIFQWAIAAELSGCCRLEHRPKSLPLKSERTALNLFPPSSLVAPAVFEVSKSLPSSSDTRCLDVHSFSSSPPSEGCTSSVPHLTSGVATTVLNPHPLSPLLLAPNCLAHALGCGASGISWESGQKQICHKIGHCSTPCNSKSLLQPSACELPGSVSELVNSAQPPSLPASAPQVMASNQIGNLALIEAGEAKLLHEVDDIAGSSLISAVQLSPVETPNSSGRLPSDEFPLLVVKERKLKYLSPLARRVVAQISSLHRVVDKSVHKDVAFHGLASSPSDYLNPQSLDSSLMAEVSEFPLHLAMSLFLPEMMWLHPVCNSVRDPALLVQGTVGCELDEGSFLFWLLSLLKMPCCHHWHPTFDFDLSERLRTAG